MMLEQRPTMETAQQGNTEATTLRLPNPDLEGCKPFAEILSSRKTERDIGARPIPMDLLSGILFAARGKNRPFGPFGAGGMTAASASNSQEVDVYVALEDAAYLFDADQHALIRVVDEDVRRLGRGPRQPLLSPDAPVELIFVADLEKLEHTRGFDEPGLHDAEVQKSYYYVDTGLIAGNVHLFAAARGLACWFHNCDRSTLAQKLRLRNKQRVLFAQTLGYPSKTE